MREHNEADNLLIVYTPSKIYIGEIIREENQNDNVILDDAFEILEIRGMVDQNQLMNNQQIIPLSIFIGKVKLFISDDKVISFVYVKDLEDADKKNILMRIRACKEIKTKMRAGQAGIVLPKSH